MLLSFCVRFLLQWFTRAGKKTKGVNTPSDNKCRFASADSEFAQSMVYSSFLLIQSGCMSLQALLYRRAPRKSKSLNSSSETVRLWVQQVRQGSTSPWLYGVEKWPKLHSVRWFFFWETSTWKYSGHFLTICKEVCECSKLGTPFLRAACTLHKTKKINPRRIRVESTHSGNNTIRTEFSDEYKHALPYPETPNTNPKYN